MLLRRLRPHLTFANVTSLTALFIALGGGAYAATQINGRELVNRSVAGSKLKKNGVSGTEVNEATLKKVPSARSADRATTATRLAPPPSLHVVGLPGQPQFQNGCRNAGMSSLDVAFFKDHDGVVHLQGNFLGCDSNGSTIFQLPPGYRPAKGKESLFACHAFSSPCGGTIYGSGWGSSTDGAVEIDTAATGSLDGVTFRAGS